MDETGWVGLTEGFVAKLRFIRPDQDPGRGWFEVVEAPGDGHPYRVHEQKIERFEAVHKTEMEANHVAREATERLTWRLRQDAIEAPEAADRLKGEVHMLAARIVDLENRCWAIESKTVGD